MPRKFLLKPKEEVTMRAFLDRRQWGPTWGPLTIERVLGARGSQGPEGQAGPRQTGPLGGGGWAALDWTQEEETQEKHPDWTLK